MESMPGSAEAQLFRLQRHRSGFALRLPSRQREAADTGRAKNFGTQPIKPQHMRLCRAKKNKDNCIPYSRL